MLRAVIENEVADYVDERSGILDDDGRRQVVRNGSLLEREVVTGVGPITVGQPRVRDKRPSEQREIFNAGVLPKYLRKTKSGGEVIPWMYFKGISTNDFLEALQSLPGADAKDLSPSMMTRLPGVGSIKQDSVTRIFPSSSPQSSNIDVGHGNWCKCMSFVLTK